MAFHWTLAGIELLTVTDSGVAVAVCPLTGVWVLVTVRVGVVLLVGDVVTVLVAVRVTVGVAVGVRDAVGAGVREGVTVRDGVFVGVGVIVRMTVAVGARVDVGAIDAALVRDAGETANASADTTKMGAIAKIRLVEMRLPIMLYALVYQFVTDPSRRRVFAAY
ncbi:MAG: hypothetical protein EB107_00935 [Proteobacteria bacterium]|nr:hypothetical protein [Pseudomonadota bacterium]